MINIINKSYSVSIYSSIMLLLIGLLLFINPGLVVSVISYIIGFFLMAIGISQIIKYYQNRENTAMAAYLFIGIVVSVIGFILILKPTLIATIIPVIVGIFMLMNSIEKITLSISLKEQSDKWYITFIFGILTLVLSIFLILNPLTGSLIVTELLGIILIVYSVLDLVEKFAIKKKLKSVKKEVSKETKIIDAE